MMCVFTKTDRTGCKMKMSGSDEQWLGASAIVADYFGNSDEFYEHVSGVENYMEDVASVAVYGNDGTSELDVGFDADAARSIVTPTRNLFIKSDELRVN